MKSRCIASTAESLMLLLQAVTLDQQTCFWRSLFPSDLHHRTLWFALLYSTSESNKSFWKTETRPLSNHLKITEQPQKHRRRHWFPAKDDLKSGCEVKGVFVHLSLTAEQQGISEEWSHLLHHVTRLSQSWDLKSLYSWNKDTTSLFHTQHQRLISPSKKDVPGVLYSEDWQKTGSTEKKVNLKYTLWIVFLIPIVIKT